MNRKVASLIHTPETWKIIGAKADQAFPGKGVTFFIQQELRKELTRSKDICFPCQYTKVEKVTLNFVIPETMIEGINCLCEKLSVRPATLISMIVIEPYILGK